MIKKLKFLNYFFLFILFSTFFPNFNKTNKSIFFSIKNIEIKDIYFLSSKEIESSLSNIKNKNLLFVSNDYIQSKLVEYDFISSFQVKKVFPNTLVIKIKEKKPVAIHFDGKKNFYISENGDFINFIALEKYKNLPFVFGKNIDFGIFFQNMKKINFPLSEVKSYHYFDIGRWDITFKNGKILKLPKQNYEEILEKFISIMQDKTFEKYKIFDYRIKNQLILN